MDSVASRYAIALLSVARDSNQIKEYNSEVESIINIISNNKGFISLLSSYDIKTNEKKEILNKVFKNKINQYILNLMCVVVDNNRCKYLLDILKEFDRISLNELNVKKGIIYTTIKLTKQQIEKLNEKVSKILKANVYLVNEIDTKLIGGFKIVVDDYIIDDSLKYRLMNLKDEISLKKGE